MKKNNLTPKQEKVLKIISDYISENSCSPTISELREALNVSSSRTVTQYLEALEKQGRIRRDKYLRRGIIVIKKEIFTNSSIAHLPLLGYAGCDNQSIIVNPIFDEYISVSSQILKDKKDVIAVMAVGNSMSAAGIDSGDVVLIERTEQVNNNDKVLAVIDGMAIIKRIRFAENSIILNPDSKEDHHKPIVMHKDFKVVGRVVEVIKKQHGENKEEILIPIIE